METIITNASQNRRNSGSGNAAIYISLFALIVIDSMGMGVVYPVFATIFNPSNAASILPAGATHIVADFCFGFTASAYPIGMLLGAPIIGDYSDYIGRRKVLLFCVIATGIGFFMSGFFIHIKSILLLAATRFFSGFMAGNCGIAQASIIDISTPEKKTTNLSMISLASSIGVVIGPLIGGYIPSTFVFDVFGYAGSFLVAGILAMINAVMIYAFYKETFTMEKEARISILKGFRDFVHGLTDRKLQKISLMLLLMQTAWSTYFQVTTLTIVQYFHLNTSSLGSYLSTLGVFYGFTMLVIVRIATKFMRPMSMLLYSLLILMAGFIIGSFYNLVLIWAALIPIAVGVGISYMAMLTLFSDFCDKQSQGLAMGTAASMSSGGWFLGAIISGSMTGISFTLPHMLAVLFVTISTLIAINLYTRQKGILSIGKMIRIRRMQRGKGN